MSLSIGIVGLPNVGKSTLFNALTKKSADASNYPFCTIDPNVGVVEVPDERLAKIAAVSRPKKIIPTTVEFVDIAGLVKGAHKGEGLGNKFLHNIRECDAVCEVIRDFEDKNITHVHGRIDPGQDRGIINLELIMADLGTVDKRLEKTAKEAKSGDKSLLEAKKLLERLKAHLEAEKPAREMTMNEDEAKILKSLNLITAKPALFIVNCVDNAGAAAAPPALPGVNPEAIIALNIKQEQEIASLPEAEQAEFIRELGLKLSGLDKLIQSSYRLLDLITFFTTGPDETRAWTVKAGTKAPQAAGVIHTDFEKGFIRAEVINWEKFIAVGSEAAARDQGLMRTEGKEYIIQDGDICHFLFNK